MISGGDRETMIQKAQRYLCGGAFYPDETASQHTDPACADNVSTNFGTAYDAIAAAPEGAQFQTAITSNMEAYLQKAFASVVDACMIEAGITAGDTRDSAYTAGDQCIAAYVAGSRPITHGQVSHTLFSDYVQWAVQMVLTGVPDTVAFGEVAPVPQDFRRDVFALIGITADTPASMTPKTLALNDEIVRIYREAMERLPGDQQDVRANQEAVSRSVLEAIRRAKADKDTTAEGEQPMSDDEFYSYLVTTYVDRVDSQTHTATLRQIPSSIASGLHVQATNTRTLGELRRLFVQVENQVRDHEQVKTHLATLTDPTARENFLNPIREAIATKLVQAAGPRLEHLGDYKAEATFQVASNGASVTVQRVELVRIGDEERVQASGLPQTLVNALDAANSIVRYAAIARIWGEVTTQAPAAANAGELQTGLVANLVGQLNGKPDDELSLTYVRANGVDQEHRRVALERAPRELLDRSDSPAGSNAIRIQVLRIYREALNNFRTAHAGTALDDAALTALARAVRTAIRPTILNPETIWTLPNTHVTEVARNADGSFRVEVAAEEAAQSAGSTTSLGDGWEIKPQLQSNLLCATGDINACSVSGRASARIVGRLGRNKLTISLPGVSVARSHAIVPRTPPSWAFGQTGSDSYSANLVLPQVGLSRPIGGFELDAAVGFVSAALFDDVAGIGDASTTAGTGGIAGGGSGLGARVQVTGRTSDALSLGALVYANSGVSKLRLDGSDAVWTEGLRLGGAGQIILKQGHFGVTLTGGGSTVNGGTMDGQRALTGELGVAYSMSDDHSVEAGARIGRRNNGTVDLNERTFGVAYNRGPFNTVLNYSCEDGEMTVGSEGDFGSDFATPDTAGSTSIEQPIIMCGASATVGYSIPFGVFVFNPQVGAYTLTQQGGPNLTGVSFGFTLKTR